MTPYSYSRVMSFIDVAPGNCWIWQGGITDNGYGRVWADGKNHPPQRLVYEHLEGLVPAGLELDHLCRVRTCCNPDHLEPVTHRENSRRSNNPAGINSRKTHCNYGHEFTAENTWRSSRGTRACRTCAKRRMAEFNARRAA